MNPFQNTLLDSPVIVTGDMDQVQVQSFAFGQVALYTRRSPEKDTPNEDAALVFPVDEERGVLAVADGVGGMQGGAAASRTALKSLLQAIKTAASEDWSVREAVLDGFDEANRAVVQLGGAATTLVAVRIQDRTIRTFHVGDSSALVVGNRGKVKLQTVDHSPTGYAVHAGVLDEEEAIHHEERHIILNAVGSPDMSLEIGSPLTLSPRDTVLLASDGLHDNLHLAEIVDLIRKGPLKRAAQNLVARCQARMTQPDADAPSKPDDLTLILFRPPAHRG